MSGRPSGRPSGKSKLMWVSGQGGSLRGWNSRLWGGKLFFNAVPDWAWMLSGRGWRWTTRVKCERWDRYRAIVLVYYEDFGADSVIEFTVECENNWRVVEKFVTTVLQQKESEERVRQGGVREGWVEAYLVCASFVFIFCIFYMLYVIRRLLRRQPVIFLFLVFFYVIVLFIYLVKFLQLFECNLYLLVFVIPCFYLYIFFWYTYSTETVTLLVERYLMPIRPVPKED